MQSDFFGINKGNTLKLNVIRVEQIAFLKWKRTEKLNTILKIIFKNK